MNQVLFRTFDDLDRIRKIMTDPKNKEDIVVMFDVRSIEILNVSTIIEELNYIRIDNNYEVTEYGFTDKTESTFGYLYQLKED